MKATTSVRGLAVPASLLLAWAALGLLARGVLQAPLPPARADVDRATVLGEDLQALFAGVDESVRPAVVFVTATRILPVSEDDPVMDLLSGRRELRQRSLGSGVIIDRRGFILTNAHVVGDSDDLSVKLWDGRGHPARVVQKDEGADIALLKVDAPGLREIPMGDSDDLKVGHWVLAVGSPFGLTQTVSAGIVSAMGRTGLGLLPYESFIQTDAAINQGNSGGPLVDLRGRLVGINTAIVSTGSGMGFGIGFAVPVNLARALVGKWIQGRTSNYLGIKVARIDHDAARYFDLSEPRGALVEKVVKGSPAERDGLEERDVILSFNGAEVRDESHFRFLLAQADAGKPIEVEVLRIGKTEPRRRIRLGLTLTDRDLGSGLPPPRQAVPGSGAHMLGITVVALTAELARQLSLPEGMRGVAVIEVDSNSPADAKGVREGDVIVEVNGREVVDVAGLREAMDARGKPGEGGDVVMLRILREGENIGYKFLPR